MLQADDVERLSRYLAGDLDEAEAAAVREALARDPELAEALQHLQALDAVTAQLAHEPHGLDVAAAISRSVPARPQPRRAVWLLAAAALALLGAFAAWRLVRVSRVETETTHLAAAVAGVRVLPGTEHFEEGEHVSRLEGGTALYTGEWLVLTPERTFEVHGKALISTNPSDALSHVTTLATPTPEESDMIRNAASQFSLGASVAVLVFSGVVQADAPVKAGQTWVAKGPSKSAPSPEALKVPAQQPAQVEEGEQCDPSTCKPEPEGLMGPAQEVHLGNSPSVGPADAKVTVVLFSEAECEFCVRAHGVMKDLMKQYQGKVRFVFKHFPLPRHAGARQAAIALHAAHAQGKFWQMVESAYGEPVSTESGLYDAQARALGLDLQQYRRDVVSPKTAAVIDADIEEGKRLGVKGVPAWFINGKQLMGYRPLETMKGLLDAELSQ